jgi:hypothetical protein
MRLDHALPSISVWMPERRNTMPLVTTSQFKEPDSAFVMLVEARRGLSQEDAAALDARLVLILANHIGDVGVLKEAIALARQSAR